jgi:hypothetical protein
LVPGRTAPPRVEGRSAALPRRPERGWIESGLYVAALPMMIAMGMMLAPVIWMFGSRPRN